ncbi:hypothetical protein V500_03087 [Pseudogymnoascus sp. VKM F-4518 (FW-2643)]|nr:hypothetical protein V500_03087 [Pseudogymnoascus sp. VKM F-4518 (FW-2643)]
MLAFRNEKQRLRYLRSTSSGPIILQDPRNGNISCTSTSDLESLEKEMERLRLQAQVTPKATATTMAHRRFPTGIVAMLTLAFNCDRKPCVSAELANIVTGSKREMAFAIAATSNRAAESWKRYIEDTAGHAISKYVSAGLLGAEKPHLGTRRHRTIKSAMAYAQGFSMGTSQFEIGGIPVSAYSQLGLAILPTDVKLITKPEDVYQWSILTPGKAALFNKQLSKHSTGAYIDLCNGAGVHFKAVLAEGAADYEPETPLLTTITPSDAPKKSREHPSSDAISFQLSAEEWREKFNAEVAKREALEIEMIEIKGENAELLTEMKTLHEEEATRYQELEKAREVLLITSRLLQQRALKASEDSQKITQAATSLKLGSNPCM